MACPFFNQTRLGVKQSPPALSAAYLPHLFIVAMHVMTVVRDKGSLAPLSDKNLSDSCGVDAAAVAAKKSVDSGPSRTPSSLAFFFHEFRESWCATVSKRKDDEPTVVVTHACTPLHALFLGCLGIARKMVWVVECARTLCWPGG